MAALKIFLISNMYPSTRHPRYGIFVQNFEKNLSKYEISFLKTVLIDTKKVNFFYKLLKYLRFYLSIIIKGLFKQKSFDVVYIHFPIHIVIPFYFVLAFLRKPIVLNYHGSDLVPDTLLKKILFPLQKHLTRFAALVVVPSNYYKQKVNKLYGIDMHMIYVYPSGGINTETFKPLEISQIIEFKNSQGYSSDTFIIGFIGNLIKAKGWETLIRSIQYLQYQIKNIQCIIIGDGPDKNEIISTLSHSGMQKHFKIINSLPQEELPKFYNLFDLFIFPTREESLGLVGVEAMACRCVVIGSNIEALRDYLIDGYNSFLFPTDNYLELSRRVIQYYNLPVHEKEVMKMNALSTSNRFNASSISEDLGSYLKELVIKK